MNNKYYTPEISDLRVGYECEANPKFYSNQEDIWIPTIMKGVGQEVIHYHMLGVYRTPYLTKEQIEAEGWKFKLNIYSDEFGNGWVIELLKGDYYFSFNQDYIAHIYKWSSKEGSSTLFTGNCPSINEFRTIIKLLNIK